jgi:hypothetical protein
MDIWQTIAIEKIAAYDEFCWIAGQFSVQLNAPVPSRLRLT